MVTSLLTHKSRDRLTPLKMSKALQVPWGGEKQQQETKQQKATPQNTNRQPTTRHLKR